jgi:hypothetical protein
MLRTLRLDRTRVGDAPSLLAGVDTTWAHFANGVPDEAVAQLDTLQREIAAAPAVREHRLSPTAPSARGVSAALAERWRVAARTTAVRVALPAGTSRGPRSAKGNR